ncbi:hypothetical protein VTO42DRAFT_7632 [Malbranchea cinnamomea]
MSVLAAPSPTSLRLPSWLPFACIAAGVVFIPFALHALQSRRLIASRDSDSGDSPVTCSSGLMSLPSLPLFLEARRHASSDPDHVAIIDKTKNQSFTYRQLLEDASRLKETLLVTVVGTKSGADLDERRIAFLVPSGYDYAVCQWAIWAAGGVCVPLCTSHPAKELLYTISDSDPSLVIIHPSFEQMKVSLLEKKPDIRFFDLVPHNQRDDAQIPPFNDSCPLTRRALMIYTSGTTSNPKGCVTTHKNITFQSQCLITAWKYTSSDHLIHVLPLHHIHGIINGLTASLLSGATVEMYPKFDPAVVWDRWCDKGSSTMFMAVPTVYSRLIDYFNANIRSTDREEAAKSGAKALRLVVSGSAALPTPIKKKFLEITGQTLLERYGMTEIGMGLSCGLEVERRIDGSVGWPLPGVQVRLTNRETGEVLEDGSEEDGMIEIKGDNVFLEYWQKPEATKKEFTPDGWFKTGDVAKRDKTGAYFIQGRASVDIIKSGGYKVSALEVERKMLALEAVQEVAVIGLTDEEWGQRVAAVVKQKPETPPLELSELRAQLKDEMAVYKIPTVLKIVDNIERNAMGKVNKKLVREKYWPGRG